LFDRERVVDDFVLLAALCGNDFMPHLPSLDIAEGAMDMLLKFYRENLVNWGGYLNQGGLINWPRLERLLTMMGDMEAHIFSERALESARMAKKAKNDARRQRAEQSYGSNGDNSESGPLPDDGADADDRDISDSARAAAEADVLAGVAKRLALERKVGQAVKGVLSDDSGLSGDDSDALDGDAQIEIEPFVLEENDFKGRYYLDKFGITYERGSTQDDLVLERIVQSYVEALQWVLLYYYRGSEYNG
jgi:5'-3' exonuclease